MEAVRAYLSEADPRTSALRALGGLLFGLGVLVLFFRRAGLLGDAWGDFVLLLVLAVPAILLYGAALAARGPAQLAAAWQWLFAVLGLILIPLALFQFIELVDGDTSSSWNTAWIFTLTGAAAIVAAVRIGLRFGLLFAGIALLIAWLGLWDEILSDGLNGDPTASRWILLGFAVLLVAAALRLRDRREALSGADLITAAGIAAVAGAGLISFTGVTGAATPPVPGLTEPPSSQASLFWDVVLLLISLGLVGTGLALGARGPVYVGAIGLTVFVFLVGLDLDDETPQGKVAGWPLFLILVGMAAFVGSLVPCGRAPATRADRAATGPAPPPPAPPG